MTTETVKYVIEAEDRATSVFRGVRSSVASTGKEVSQAAKEAKFGSQGFTMLSGAIGQAIPELEGVSASASQVTGTLSALGGASNAAGASLLLLKSGAIAGMAVATATATVELLKWIDGYDALQARLETGRQNLDWTVKRMLDLKDVEFSNWLKDVQAAEPTTFGQDRMFTNKQSVIGRDLADLQKQKEVLLDTIQTLDDNRHVIDGLFGNDDTEPYKEQLAALEAEEASLLRQADILKQMKRDNDRQQKLEDIKAAERHADAMREKAREDRAEWRKQEAEQRKAFKESLQEQLKKQEATKSHFANIKEQLIALRDGEAAARAFSLEQSGIEGGTASQIARMEEQLRQAQAGQEVKTNTASESRLLSGRVEMDAARQTANATARVRELTEKIWKQNEAMLATQEKIAKNTENQLETLR